MTARLTDLRPDPRNARIHSARNVGTITAEFREVGAARSIVIDEDNTVLAGNATIEAAAAAGIERVQVVDADGETIIAVRRRGLTPEQKARLALYDNRAAELADGWDMGVLEALQTDFPAVRDGLWTDEEWGELMRIVPDFQPVGIDEQGRLDEKAKTQCPECGHVFEPQPLKA